MEKKVKELEAGGRSSSMERVLRRNHELESEIEKLRTQLSSTHSTPAQMPSEISEDLYTQPKQELNWMPENSCQWPSSVPSHIAAIGSSPDVPVSMSMTPSTYASEQLPYQQRSSMSYEQDTYAPNLQVWNEPVLFGQHAQNMSKTAPSWSSFHPTFHQPTRFGDMQSSGFTDLVSLPFFYLTSPSSPACLRRGRWQPQLSISCFQLSSNLQLPTLIS